MRKYGIFFVIALALSSLVFSQSSRVRLATLEQGGATTNQALKWSGTKWQPGSVALSETTGTASIAQGGTNSSATPTAGAVAYGNGSSYLFSSVGTAGQILQSNGAVGPSFITSVPLANALSHFPASTVVDMNADRGIGARNFAYTTGTTNAPSAVGMVFEARRQSGSGSDAGTFQISAQTDSTPDIFMRKITGFSTVDQYSSWQKIMFDNSILLAAQLPALTGDITSSVGSNVTNIATNIIADADLVQIANGTFKGRATAGTGNVETLTSTQATSLLNTFTGSLKGLVPAPTTTAGTTVLFDNGTWSVPPGAGGGDSINVNGLAVVDANFNKTTPANTTGSIPVGFATSGSSPASISASVDMADSFDARRQKPFMNAEFLSTSTGNMSEFLGAAIAAGTNTTTPAAATLSSTHPGVVLARSSTTANSGYQYSSTLNLIRLGGGEQFDTVIWLPAAATGNSLRFGFQDSITSTAPVDGAYIDFAVGVNTPTCKTSSNSVVTTSATIATLSVSTWYHMRVKVDSTSSVTCSIWNDAGTLQGTVSNTTNIPTASGRELGVAVVGTNSGTVAADVFAIDYLSVGWVTAIARGK